MSTRPSTRDEPGFTLIEVLISITVLGLIMSVLALATVTVIRTTPITEERVDEARAMRALTSWLNQDATSTLAVDVTPSGAWAPPSDPYGFDTHPDNPGLCGAMPGTTNLVQLAWRNSAGSTYMYVADYRFEPGADSATVLRVTCEGTSGSLGEVDAIQLAGGFAAIQDFPNVATYDDGANELHLALVTVSNVSITIDITSRNPGTP